MFLFSLLSVSVVMKESNDIIQRSVCSFSLHVYSILGFEYNCSKRDELSRGCQEQQITVTRERTR